MTSIGRFLGKLESVFSMLMWLAPIFCYGGGNDPVQFVFDDFYHYQEAIAAIDGGDEPQHAFARYLERGTPGLQQFAQTYAVDAASLSVQWQQHEDYYRSLMGLQQHFPIIEAQARDAILTMSQLDPGLTPKPVHLLIGALRAGGANDNTVAGVQIGLEIFGAVDGAPLASFADRAPRLTPAQIAPIVVHEMAHIYQEQLQGSATYVDLYTEPGKATLLALALREGGADFVASHYSGASMIPATTAFGLANEPSLWPLFAAEMHGEDTGDWMFRRPRREGWPQDLGYFMGTRIANAYYQRAQDKRQALRDILRINDFEAFLAASGYGS